MVGKWAGGALTLFVVFLAGCRVTDVEPPIPSPTVSLVEEDAGWVKVNVSDVPSEGYVLHWGDVESAYGESAVFPWQGSYEHFYQSAGQHTILLSDGEGNVIAEAEVTVSAVDCHVSLVSLENRTILVRYFGRDGVDYSVSWGDGYSEHVVVYRATSLLVHTYGAPGTYYVGMAEIWAPMRSYFSVAVE